MTVAQLSPAVREVEIASVGAQSLRQQLLQALEVHNDFLTAHGVEVDDDIQLALGRLAERNVGEIRAALERMESGTYGRCESCSLVIAPDRLEAIPYARCCASCAATTPRM